MYIATQYNIISKQVRLEFNFFFYLSIIAGVFDGLCYFGKGKIAITTCLIISTSLTWWSFPSLSGPPWTCHCCDPFWWALLPQRMRSIPSRRHTRPDPFPSVSSPEPWARPRTTRLWWRTSHLASPSWPFSCRCLWHV